MKNRTGPTINAKSWDRIYQWIYRHNISKWDIASRCEMKKKPLQTFRRLVTKLLWFEKWQNMRRFDTLMSKTHGCVNPCYPVFGVSLILGEYSTACRNHGFWDFTHFCGTSFGWESQEAPSSPHHVLSTDRLLTEPDALPVAPHVVTASLPLVRSASPENSPTPSVVLTRSETVPWWRLASPKLGNRNLSEVPAIIIWAYV